MPLTVSTGSLLRRGIVSLTAEADKSGLLEQVAVHYSNTASSAILSFRVASNRWGSATVRLAAQGDWSDLATNTFSLQINVPPPKRIPEVSLLQPKSGLVYQEGQPIEVVAEVSGFATPLPPVQFWVGTNCLGSVTEPPFRLIWNNPPTGFHAFRAVAGGKMQGQATSSAVTIAVEPRPRLTVLPPSLGMSHEISIRIQGPAGFAVVTWATSEPGAWTAVSTNSLTDGSATVVRPVAYPARFYRAELRF